MLTEFDVSQLRYVHSEVGGAVASPGNYMLLLKCPAASASFAGAVLSVKATAVGATLSGYSTVEVFEAPTPGADGTARTPQNTNRTGTPPASAVTVFLNTAATGGTSLQKGYASLSQDFQSKDFILKPATNYLVKVTNSSGAALTDSTLTVELNTVTTLDYLYRVVS